MSWVRDSERFIAYRNTVIRGSETPDLVRRPEEKFYPGLILIRGEQPSLEQRFHFFYTDFPGMTSLCDRTFIMLVSIGKTRGNDFPANTEFKYKRPRSGWSDLPDAGRQREDANERW